jgi:hypothetical protein
MANLGEFLGALLKSISNARVNSDIQSVKIAEEYAKNDLLKHFAAPSIRVKEVQFEIPVAFNELIEKSQKVYEPIDNKSFSSKAYKQILKSLTLSSLPSDVSKTLKTTIAEHIHLVEAKIRVNQIENVLEDFSKNIALKIVDLADLIFKDSERKKLNRDELLILQNTITKELQESLKDEIKFKSENKVLESLEVIIEADKLREIKPGNLIMIKMTVSEQGMEWVNMENINGDVVTKLMPE